MFEGLRGYSNSSGQLFLFRLQDHLRRLFQSCRLLGIQSPYSSVQIEEAIITIIKLNKMKTDLACRVTLFVDGNGSWASDGPVDMFVSPILKPRFILDSTSGKSAAPLVGVVR